MAIPNQNNTDESGGEEPQQEEDSEQEQEDQDQQAKEVVVSKMYTTNIDPNNPLPLDWTKLGMDNTESDIPVRCPSEVAEWSQDETEICIVGTSGMKVTFLGTDFADDSTKTNMKGLKSLVLRSHLLKDMSGLGLLPNLTTLELYDNMIQKLDVDSLKGSGPTTLQVLDMSYNAIRSMAPLQHCCGDTLTEIYLANNKLKEITGLSHLKNLRKIDLGANRIRVLPKEEFSGLTNLEELWLGKNKIESLEGIESLTKLKRLDVQSNRLTTVSNTTNGLCYLNAQRDNLEELYLAHNGLDDEGVSGLVSQVGVGNGTKNFPKLTVLDLSNNRLTSTSSLFVDGTTTKTDENSGVVFGEWPALEELWFSGNAISDFDALLSLKDASSRNHLPELETVYLEYNPVSKDFEYRKKLAEFLPTLKQIDATMIYGNSPALSTDVGGVLMPSRFSAVLPTEERLRQLQAAAIERAMQQQQEHEQNPVTAAAAEP